MAEAARTIYPLHAARALALHVQGLAVPNPPGFKPGPDEIASAVKQIGAVQIDTLQMVRRSHYLVLWSRLGSYKPQDFDRLIYSPESRLLYEDWLHAACIVPLENYRYSLPRKLQARQKPGSWYERWLSEGEHLHLMDEVVTRIQAEGPLRTGHFKHNGPRRGAWWDWTPAKRALEWQFAFGGLMVSERVNFQRVYDLTERVLPAWVDASIPTPEEVELHLAEMAVRCLGVCTVDQSATYSYRKLAAARPAARELLKRGILQTVQVETADGYAVEMVIHKDNLPLLEQAADGALTARRTTFLSFFDNLFWAKGRDEQLWKFQNHLEAYTPADKRVYGYFSLPILYRDRLIGRFDPKLDRKQAVLYLRNLHLNPDVEPEEEMIHDLAGAFKDFLQFHNARSLVIERSQPAAFADRLLAVL